ncbi:MAG: hypothetical protein C4576_10525 [Desulfobacteraceae bacterium]|nr:MAG: hypothetical protein C4576_10525 [Desulfobacteraceae bacterium]
MPFFCLFSGMPAFADQVDFWIQTPEEWENRTGNLGRDLLKQVVAPGGVAVIEVYEAKGGNLGLQVIADKMEQSMLARGASYLQSRTSSSRHNTTDGRDAIFREYKGVYNGIPLRTRGVFTFGNGGAVAAFGFYAENGGAQCREAIWESIGSIRFTAPGVLPMADSGDLSGIVGASTSGAQHPGGAGCIGLFKRGSRPDLDYVRDSDKKRTKLQLARQYLA